MKQRSYNPLILTLIVVLAGLSIVIYKAPIAKEAHTTSEIRVKTHENTFTSTSTLMKRTTSYQTITKTTIFDDIGDSRQPSVGDIEYVVFEEVGSNLKITMKLGKGKFSIRCYPNVGLGSAIYLDAPVYVITIQEFFGYTECLLFTFYGDEIIGEKRINDFEITKDTFTVMLPLSYITLLYPEYDILASIYGRTGDALDNVPNDLLAYVNINHEQQYIQTFYSTWTSTLTSTSETSSTTYSTYYVSTPIKERNLLFPLLLGSVVALLLFMILDTADKDRKKDKKEVDKSISTDIDKKHCIFCGSEIPKIAEFCEKCGKKIKLD